MRRSAGAEAPLHAAAASVDLTPRWPVPLGGHVGRSVACDDVRDPLEANVLVLRQATRTVALVTCDLLYVGDALRKAVEAQVRGVVPPECLFMAASHTHFAPMTQRGMPLLGDVDERYLAECASALSARLVELTRQLVPARISERRGHGPEGWSINRRLPRLRVGRHGIAWDASFAPNHRGRVHRALRVLRVDAENGAPLAVVWNYACHPTAFPSGSFVSAEYPGRVRAAVRRALNAGIPVLFLQGFAGDVRPPFRRREAGLRGGLRRALRGPEFGAPAVAEYEAWADAMGSAVAGMAVGEGRRLAPALVAARARADLARFTDGPSGRQHVVAHVLQLAADAVLVGLGVEPLTGLLTTVERCVAPGALIPVGYIDRVPCYLPADSDLRHGGYEVSGFRRPFAMEPQFRRGIDREVGELVRHAIARARALAAAAPRRAPDWLS